MTDAALSVPARESSAGGASFWREVGAARTVWGVAFLLWGTLAVLAGTHQWTELRGTGKELAWIHALLWQGTSWLLLVPATPLLLAIVRRAPLDRGHPRRLAAHTVAAFGFGVLFLLVSVPIRLAFHPSPMRWTFFGEAFYKSIPQCAVLGIGLYGAVVIVATLLEARQRLAATLEAIERDPPPVGESGATTDDDSVVVLRTPGGMVRLPARAIRWIEPVAGGARLHGDDDAILLRHALTELERDLAGHGFVRTHRSVLVNAARIRRVSGAPTRDGTIELDCGTALPVTRRRRAALDGAL